MSVPPERPLVMPGLRFPGYRACGIGSRYPRLSIVYRRRAQRAASHKQSSIVYRLSSTYE
jgi:hypothetical protein